MSPDFLTNEQLNSTVKEIKTLNDKAPALKVRCYGRSLLPPPRTLWLHAPPG